MRQVWLTFALVAVAGLLASTVDAQRWSQVRNMNTHEGKYSTGGFGFSVGAGFARNSNFRRESLSSESVGGALEAVFTKNNAQSMTRSIFGADIDFQIGSDNSVIGTDFGLEIYSFSLGTNATRDFDNDAYLGVNESVMLMYAGFDFTINLYESEFLEPDGRRTRENWGLSLIVGPKVGLMFGDFSDLNGLASIGLDFGVMFDFPIGISGAEDLLSISPFVFAEANYRMGVDGGLVDPNPGSPTGGQDVINDNFDTGFYNLTTDDPNGFDGIAVRRHNFIPSYAINIGTDVNLTPIFTSRDGGIINNWRFNFSVIASIPVEFELIMADYNGAPMAPGGLPMSATFSIGASYFW